MLQVPLINTQKLEEYTLNKHISPHTIGWCNMDLLSFNFILGSCKCKLWWNQLTHLCTFSFFMTADIDDSFWWTSSRQWISRNNSFGLFFCKKSTLMKNLWIVVLDSWKATISASITKLKPMCGIKYILSSFDVQM